MNFKDAVSETKRRLEALAEGADTLENKNLRDILLRGAAKLGQALEHPDIEAVDAAADGGPKQEPLPFEPGPFGGSGVKFSPDGVGQSAGPGTQGDGYQG